MPAYPSHIFVVPDGSRTWLVVSGDVELAKAKANALLDANAATIASRPEAKECFVPDTTFCGFFDARSFVPWGNVRTPEEVDQWLATVDKINAMSAPPVSLRVKPHGDRAELEGTLSWKTLLDFLTLAQ